MQNQQPYVESAAQAKADGKGGVDDDPEIAEGMPQDENAAAAQMMQMPQG